ncbi:hypothetical protein [Hymenobacter cellulosilyticus]|uniref:Outer membrane protein beta-barrel domain-containing protein n=1 Tax=Hymenobacter cellulosilyticus TaxID=2932248 RepID=A0A8T9Q305_9BACT|nr:hypothetical protein [Hymenobacter cellulosilyticus]UOQ72106.1 hypothetical protein MUN79_26660 [Hymenobacter cellulosilyticus]
MCLPQTVGKKAAKRGSFDFGLVAGLSVYDQFIMGKGNNTSDYDQVYEGKSTLKAGLEAVYTPGFKGAPFTVRAALVYEPGRTFTSERSFYPQAAVNKKALMELDYAVLSAMVRYRIGQHRLRPYLEGGLSLNMLVRVKQDYVTYTTTGNNTYYTNELLGSHFDLTYGGKPELE